VFSLTRLNAFERVSENAALHRGTESTRSSAMAEGSRDALCQFKSCHRLL